MASLLKRRTSHLACGSARSRASYPTLRAHPHLVRLGSLPVAPTQGRTVCLQLLLARAQCYLHSRGEVSQTQLRQWCCEGKRSVGLCSTLVRIESYPFAPLFAISTFCDVLLSRFDRCCDDLERLVKGRHWQTYSYRFLPELAY